MNIVRLSLLFFIAFFPFQSSAFAFVGTLPESVEELQNKGVFQEEVATNVYDENMPVTRGEFVQWALRNAGFSGEFSGKEPFQDIRKRDPLFPFVAAAYSTGAISDFGTTFRANASLTRLQAVKLLLAVEGVSVLQKYPTALYKKYDDLPTNASDKAAILKALELKWLYKTDDKKSSPSSPLLLKDAVEMLSRATATQKFLEETQTPTAVEQAQAVIQSYYLKQEEVSEQKLEENAITGMVSSLKDPYSEFMPTEASQEFMGGFEENNEKVEYSGIGASIGPDEKTKGFVIMSFLDHSPAQSAGIQEGDIIVSVNDESVIGKTSEDAISLIKGPTDSVVKLGIIRDGKNLDFFVIRKKLIYEPGKSVKVEEKNGIVWMKISQFGFETSDIFKQTLAEKITPQTKGLIVDLRNNPGGLLNSAQEMLGEVLPKGSVAVKTVDNNGNETVYKADGTGNFTTIPLVVFQNEFSASASEIFAGAIKDAGRGEIIGKTSFGKGIAQSIFEIPLGTIKLTTSEFFTPNNHKVHKIGITPDVEVNTRDDASFFYMAEKFLTGK